MMNKEDIILSNEKLGIKTIFFNENNGILGYTENGVIYLNEFYDDLELANKHEILHLFEESKQFLGAKKIIFDLLGEKELTRIRNEYYLKYSGLYSEEEISKGILDNEIAIDIIIGNGIFSLPINDYIVDAYTTITSKKEGLKLTSEGKRYLSLNVSKNTATRYSELSKWDLLFASKYYDGKEKPTGEGRYAKIGYDAVGAWYDLRYSKHYADFYIKTEGNPYLERRFSEIVATYKAKGDYEELNKLSNNKDESLTSLSSDYRKNLYSQFLSLSKLLDDSEYEYSFKYLILNEALTKTYRYEKGNRIVDKREKNKTILPLMLVNEFILKEIHDNIDKYRNFTDLYFDALDKYNNEFLKNRNVNFNSSELGCWIKFNQGKEGTSSFIKDSQDLGNLISDTPWCTRKSPENQLKDGDFYVFVDSFGKPRIAVQLVGNSINEVRGIKGDGDQEIEDEYRHIALDFLKKNISVEGARIWMEKEERNQRLQEFLTKIRTNTLNEFDIEDLVNTLNMRESKVHGDINSNEKKLIKEISLNKAVRDRISRHSGQAKKVLRLIDEIERNYRMADCYKKIEEGTLKIEDCKHLYEDLLYEFDKREYHENQKNLIQLVNNTDNVFKQFMANEYGCKPNEIYIGRLENNNIPFENGVCPLKIIIGEVGLSSAKDLNLSNLEYVKGSLKIYTSNTVNLSSLSRVDGLVDIIDNRNIDMSGLEMVNGNLKVFKFIDSDMSNIRIVNGNALFDFFGGMEEYKNLEEILGDLQISHVTKKMDKLKVVKGNLIWDKYCKIEALPSLEICGDLIGVPIKIMAELRYDEENHRYVKNANKR